MTNSKLIVWGLFSTLGVFLYTIGIAWLLFNGDKLFGQATDFWMPAVLLLLFILSAVITGLLVIGGPIYLYLNGSVREAVKLFCYTVFFLFLITVVVLITRLLF